MPSKGRSPNPKNEVIFTLIGSYPPKEPLDVKLPTLLDIIMSSVSSWSSFVSLLKIWVEILFFDERVHQITFYLNIFLVIFSDKLEEKTQSI